MSSANTTSYPSRTIGRLGNSIVTDNSSDFGKDGQLRNINAMVSQAIVCLSTGSSTAATVPAAAFPAGVWDLQAGASGDFTLTLPTTAALLAAYPNTIPADGQFNFSIDIINDTTTHTATLTAGDSSTTIVGTATIASNYCRTYQVNLNLTAKTSTWINKGVKAL
jgi:hypothetical protein